MSFPRPFEQGRSLREQFTARRMNDMQRSIPVIRYSGGGARVSHLGNQVFVQTPRRQSNISAPFPFQVLTRPKKGSPGSFEAKVELHSDLMKSGQPNDNLTITGLDTWFAFIATDVICVSIDVTDLVPSGATIRSYGQGNTTFDPTFPAWDPTMDGYLVSDGGDPAAQAGAFILIASSVPDDHGNPKLTQHQFTHMLLEEKCIAGISSIFDWSHRSRYVSA